jgi:hypothetical protein
MTDALAKWEQYSNPGAASGATPLGAGSGPVAKTQATAGRLEPLATPLMAGGVSGSLLDRFAPVFQAQGLTPLQAGSAGKAPEGTPVPAIEPGSVLAVPLLIGDVDMTAIGTTTEVLDGRVYGFGHPFNNEGQVILPMGRRAASTTSSRRSRRASSSARWSGPAGTITADRSVGIAGRMGASPQLVPIDLRVTYADGSSDVSYHFEGAKHPRFTPLLAGMAVMSALSGTSELPQYNTVDYDINLEFSNGKTIQLSDKLANAADRDLFRFIGLPLLTPPTTRSSGCW